MVIWIFVLGDEMFRIIFLGFLVFTVSCVLVPTNAYAMSLDDDEEDAEDVADLLDKAKKAGKRESFGEADTLLQKAKMYGTASSDIGDAEQYVSAKKKARDDRLERERKERERLAIVKRQKEERARQARLARQRQQSSSSSSSSYDYVMVQFESVCGLYGCTDKNLHISGGPGNFSPSYSGAAAGAIHKGYNGFLAGNYRWSAQFDNTVCSGNFYVSGSKRNITISIHPGCSDLYISRY